MSQKKGGMKIEILKEIISENLQKSKLKKRANLAKDAVTKQMRENKTQKKEKRKDDITPCTQKRKRN